MRMERVHGGWTGRARAALVVAAGMLLAAGEAVAAPAPLVPSAFLNDPIWSDGKAEMSFYEGTEVRYNQPRQALDVEMIVVKEDHNAQTFTKADTPEQAQIPAMKLNWVTVIPTGTYVYRQMASVFADRRTGQPFRETFTSNEGCGNVFKELRLTRGGPATQPAGQTGDAGKGFTYRWISYFGEDAEGQKRIDTQTEELVIYADALPLLVRTLPFGEGDGEQSWKVTLLPTLRSLRATPKAFEPQEVTIRVVGRETVEVPAGKVEAWKVQVGGDQGEPDTYWVEAGPYRRLVRMTQPNGTEYRLRKTMRIDYWNRNGPQDGALRQGTGMTP